jgi:hypothetical protein
MKKWPYKRVASIDGDNLVVFYYPTASEIFDRSGLKIIILSNVIKFEMKLF